MQTNRLKIIKKEELCPGTYLFQFSLSESINYLPGQFVVLQIEPKIFRSYSIIEVSKDNIMSLLIDVRVGGPASKFFEKAQEGTELNLIGKPLGKFILRESSNPKIFIATGTGLAPFIPMVKAALAANAEEKIDLFFGIRHVGHDYCKQFFADCPPEKFPNFTVHSCISQPEKELPQGTHEGRVTKIIPEILKDYEKNDYYLCGNPKMVDEMTEILQQKGCKDNIFAERY